MATTSPDTDNISIGPGVLWYAPLGTTEPADHLVSWPAGWLPIGYTAEGHQGTYALTIADVEVAERLDVVRRITTKRDNRVAFAMAEITSDNLALALNGGTLLGMASTFTDGATTSGSPNVTSATAAFVPADVGRRITGAGIPAGATIITRTSATAVVISANATATATGVSISILGRQGSWFSPPNVGSEVRHMLGWDADDGTERIVWRRVLQAGTMTVPRRKGAEFARFTTEFALEEPGGGLEPFIWGLDEARISA